MYSENRKRLEKKVSVWDFSPLSLSNDDLIHCAVIMISQVFLLSQVTRFSEGKTFHLLLFIVSKPFY